MVIAEDNCEYKQLQYWNTRYEQEQEFDWFKQYRDLRPILRQFFPAQPCSILMLGCGNSSLSQDMYSDGFTDIVNVDYSDVLIQRMSLKYPHMRWIVDDVQKLEFIPNESIDVCLDKGTMDALMCDKGDVWDPSPELIEDCRKEVDQVMRVLKPGGTFIYITFGQPHFRLRHLERPGKWQVQVQTIGDSFHYFIYSMVKL